jgi:hypothetical protein
MCRRLTSPPSLSSLTTASPLASAASSVVSSIGSASCSPCTGKMVRFSTIIGSPMRTAEPSGAVALAALATVNASHN